MRYYSVFLLLFSISTYGQSLQEVVGKAWLRNPQVVTLEAKRAELEARKSASESLIPAPPTIGLATRSDRFTGDRGKLENEAEFSMPVWLLGQKTAQAAFAQSEYDENEAALQEAKLAVAGEVREMIWDIVDARNDVDLAQKRSQTARELEDDVVRRVKAGDLAHSDLLTIQTETLTASAALIKVETHFQQLSSRYSILVGPVTVPMQPEETVSAASVEQHPRLLLYQQTVRRAQAQLQVVNRSFSDNPEIAMRYRWERDEFSAPASKTIGIGVRIPLGSDARNKLLIAAAQKEQVKAITEAELARIKIEAQINEAQFSLSNAEKIVGLLEQRYQVAKENAGLIKKSFNLGESSLAALIRMNALLHEAEAALVQQRNAMSRARARVNQARGVLP